jgi:hypothetical protein
MTILPGAACGVRIDDQTLPDAPVAVYSHFRAN